jgi:exodeoxyribonuclease V gamma subunit
MPAPVTPGLLVLHGNELEQLRATVFEWLRNNPLAPLESEVFLVQSNGVAEWLKIALAEDMKVCAATRLALPARFLWESYRAMLGREQVPSRSAFDKQPLTWRLMRLLPTLLQDPAFAPLRHFLGDGEPERRLQLAERLADLFDQYQVYRADWLADWALGRDQLRDPSGAARLLQEDQRWQAHLWRAVIDSVPFDEQQLGRATIHDVFIAAIARGDAPLGRMPRRVVLFGISALPYQSLQALAALARHCQVVLAVPNPCQFYWGDIIDGRALLRAARKRQPQRNGQDLSVVALEDLHAHSHPLLASWGRQGRDFIRMLDEFDESQQIEVAEATEAAAASVARESAQSSKLGAMLRIDLFGSGEGTTLLSQVQAAIRDLLPLAEHDFPAPAEHDQSIVFHVAHSVQREVEILHDQLLAMFAGSNLPGLRPRDIVVMVPDIDIFIAAIQSVFAQHKRGDARAIPFEIGDVKDRSVNPLLVALDWLLQLPQQRCRQSEVRDLLDVPALAARFGLTSDDLPLLGAWIFGAGVRWGLDQTHRDALGLGFAGEQNAWIFGLRRMLLGYASGSGGQFAGIEPYPEVGGLDAQLAGSLAQLVEALLAWRAQLATARTPAEWGVVARALLAAFFDAADDDDRLTLAQLGDALQTWLETCEQAGYCEAVPLAVLREAWLGGYDEPTLNHQFVSGGVTFCTLMPMRAVPFRVVCLLGMNDGDYPRKTSAADFDLLALPGMARPGDRSRRDDDRYLMLEALLAARGKLYISWVGRSVRDNSVQPPSVLVSQLRDYLADGWKFKVATLTTEHALQPFSRRYFEQGGLLTYAGEWRAAHGAQIGAGARASADADMNEETLPPFEHEAGFRLTLRELARFVRHPVKHFFLRRLGVTFADSARLGDDEEPFALDALQRYGLEDAMLEDVLSDADADADADFNATGDATVSDVRASLTERANRLAGSGVLPIGLVGQQWQRELVEALLPVRRVWLALCLQYPHPVDKVALDLRHGDLALEDWLDGLHTNATATVCLMQMSSKVRGKKGQLRGDKLIPMWLRLLAGAAEGHAITGVLVARDAIVTMAPLDPVASRVVLESLFDAWSDGMHAPLPTACKTALALLQDDDPMLIYDGAYMITGESDEPCLARLWPDYAALSSQPAWHACSQNLYGPLVAWLDNGVQVESIGADSADGPDGDSGEAS